MKVLVTGGFGGVGVCLVDELVQRGHEVTVFDLPGKRTRQAARAVARKHGDRIGRVVFGDIRNANDVAVAVTGQDAAIHMAAILPPKSEERPEPVSYTHLTLPTN